MSKGFGFFLIFVSVIATYWKVLSADFVFDTPLNLHKQGMELYAAHLDWRMALLSSRSMVWLTFLCNYLWNGLNSETFRLTNVILHCVSGCLFFLLLRNVLVLSGSPIKIEIDSEYKHYVLSLFVSLFFVLNPISQFAVAYVIQRFVLMALICVLAGLIFFLRSLKNQSLWSMFGAVLLFYVAIQCKEHSVVLLLFYALLIVFAPRAQWSVRFRSGVLIAILTMLCISTLPIMAAKGILATTYEPNSALALKQMGIEANSTSMVRDMYLYSIVNQMFYFFRYGLLWIVPLSNCISIDSPQPFFQSFTSLQVWLGMIGFVVYALLGFFLLTKLQWRWVGIFLLGSVVMFLSEFSTVRFHENFVLYRSYLWMPFLLVAIVLSLNQWMGCCRTNILSVSACAVVYLGVIIWVQQDRLALFNEPLKLWQDAVSQLDLKDKRIPGSYRTVGNYATALGYRGQIVDAHEFYVMATQMNPHYVKGWEGVGSSLALQGKLNEAIPYFEKAIQVEPQYKQAYYNLGTVYSDLGDAEKAVVNFEKALQLDPKDKDVLFNYANLLLRLKNHKDAVGLYLRALTLDVSNVDINHNLGIAYSQLGELTTAIAHYDRVLAVNPEYAKAYYNKANALAMQNHFEEALRNFDRFLKFVPDSIVALYNSGLMLHKLNRDGEAKLRMQKVLELDPTFKLAEKFLHPETAPATEGVPQ